MRCHILDLKVPEGFSMGSLCQEIFIKRPLHPYVSSIPTLKLLCISIQAYKLHGFGLLDSLQDLATGNILALGSSWNHDFFRESYYKIFSSQNCTLPTIPKHSVFQG